MRGVFWRIEPPTPNAISRNTAGPVKRAKMTASALNSNMTSPLLLSRQPEGSSMKCEIAATSSGVPAGTQ